MLTIAETVAEIDASPPDFGPMSPGCSSVHDVDSANPDTDHVASSFSVEGVQSHANAFEGRRDRLTRRKYGSRSFIIWVRGTSMLVRGHLIGT